MTTAIPQQIEAFAFSFVGLFFYAPFLIAIARKQKTRIMMGRPMGRISKNDTITLSILQTSKVRRMK